MAVVPESTEPNDEYPKTDIAGLALRDGDPDGVGSAIRHAGMTHYVINRSG